MANKRSGLEDLIKALTILSKYDDPPSYAPSNCEHDVFMVHVANGESVSAEDAARLEELGFYWDGDDIGFWYSFRFGNS